MPPKLRTVPLLLIAGIAGLASAAGAAAPPPAEPPTTASSRYLVIGAGPVLRARGTVYVGGVSRVAAPTGSTVVVSAPGGTAEPVKARVAGGSVQAAIPDGTGGWYIGGTFTSVGGVGRPGLAHLSREGKLDTTFAPSARGQVRALALDAGRLYVGGVQPLGSDPWFLPVLSVLDPVTGAPLPTSYPPLAHTDESPAFGVIALAAQDGKLFAAFNGDNGIAAYDESSGALLWSRPGTPSFGAYGGPAALALSGGRLLVGGEISTPTGPVNLEELDPATGDLVGRPSLDGPAYGIATVAGTAYVLARSPHVFGLTIWKLGVTSGTLTRLTVVRGGSAIAATAGTLYVAGQLAVGGDVRVYAVPLGPASPKLRALSPVLAGGGVHALALQSGHLLVAGSFRGTGGVERGGLAAFDARTGSLLPWHPSVQRGRVAALASSGKRIYLAGAFKRVSGRGRMALAAVSALGVGKLLPWNPRLPEGSFGSLVVSQGRVFAGGSARPRGAKASTPFRHLLVFSATTGRRLLFQSRIGRVRLMAAGHRLVLAESSCNAGSGTSACVTAFRIRGDGHAVWRRSFGGTIAALGARTSTLYVGGEFSSVDGQPRSNLAALALDGSGTLLDFAPLVPLPVTALTPTDYGVAYATNAFAAGSNGPYFLGAQALGAVSPDGELLPWEMSFPPNDVPLSPRDVAAQAGNFWVKHLVAIRDGLVTSGDFSWLGPGNGPAAGNLAWLR
jgi:outer membrane protein assembly factor BamB